MKALLRELVTSATYRAESKTNRHSSRKIHAIDCWPTARSRGSPAEMVRDQALMASGLLSDNHGRTSGDAASAGGSLELRL